MMVLTADGSKLRSLKREQLDGPLRPQRTRRCLAPRIKVIPPM
jgi:hypothetical protein